MNPLQRNDEVSMLCSARDELSSPPGRTERWSLGSVLGLGALFGLTLSPCARAPLVSAFVIVGVPLCTFLVAAPSRLGLARELGLFARDAQAALLTVLCALTGRRQAAAAVVARHRERVEARYADLCAAPDALRLHHARRVGAFGAALSVMAGVGLPFVHSSMFTFGELPFAPVVFLCDVLVIGLASRVVAERMTLRLFEASTALGTGEGAAAQLRVVSLTTVLGCALGAVGSLVVLSAAAAASGLETTLMFQADFMGAALWFMRVTASMALPLGIGIGAVVGCGIGLARRR
jgi:hypothetical protein